MAALIVQLSDIHCKSASDPIFAKLDLLAKAVAAIAPDYTHCFIILCGDLAFSGQTYQFESIGIGLGRLAERLQQEAPHLHIQTIAIPGNHDCDFSQPLETRDVVLQSLASRVKTLSPYSDVIELLTLPQRAFFDYANKAGWTLGLNPDQFLYWERQFPIGADGEIRFQCYNTAWTSTLREVPAQLQYPVQIASSFEPASRPVSAAISVLHHPLYWLEPSTRRVLAAHVERTSDIVLTGHEHVRGSYLVTSEAETGTRYLEGGVLQDPDNPNASEFQCLALDLGNRRFRQFVFQWRDTHFKRTKESDWQAFERNSVLARHAFANSTEFDDYLSDLGTTFTHPRKAQLSLQDLFVYPDLQVKGLHKDAIKNRRRTASVVDSENVVTTITGHERVLIAGQATSGKTTFAKSLYTDLKQKKGIIPILLSGTNLSSVDFSESSKAVGRAFVTQYHSDTLDRFWQLERSQRAILVDDLNRSPLNRSGHQQLLEHLGQLAGFVLCFVDDLYLLDRLTENPDSGSASILSLFTTYEIKEFGWRLRGKLLSLWHHLGYGSVGDEEDISFKISQSEDFVARLLGKNLLPSVPFTILSILQISEAATTPAATGGSYGYLYEVLITTALSKISGKNTAIDTRYAYLAHIAYAVFSGGMDSISQSELEKASEQYFAAMRIRFSVTHELSDLVSAKILDRQGSSYIFKYKYVYCYFVARYFRDYGTSNPAVPELLRSLVDHIYVEDYANILTFYLYLTRDTSIIEYLLASAKNVFGEHRPTDLDVDVTFVNALFKEFRPLELPDPTTADKRREEHRRRLDEKDDQQTGGLETHRLRYSDTLNDAIKLNFAFKTLHVMGQVLRNFPGSLPGVIKEELAVESYSIGLRTLKAVLSLAKINLEQLRYYFSELIKEQRDIILAAEALVASDEIMIDLTVGCAFGIAKRVAGSVGLQELKTTYDDVLIRLGHALPARIIDITIRLEHFREPPVNEIEKLASESRRNFYVQSVLRDLVANYLYLYRVDDARVRQRLGDLFEIQGTAPKFLANPQKRIR